MDSNNTTLFIAAAFAVGVILGLGTGLGAAFALRIMQTRSGEKLAREIFRENEMRRKSEEEALLANLQNNFGRLSTAIFKKSNENFLQLAEQRLKTQTNQNSAELESRKKLIDQQLGSMATELNKVTELVKSFENDRNKKYGALNEQLTSLNETTSRLQRAIGDSRTRGQWGERIAEDILQLAGFLENVNYRKQESHDGARPDYTFMLPRNLTLNMDVKFPLDNYLKYQDAATDTDRATYRKAFLRDVLGHVNALTKRNYINPEQSTVDFVLMFIPNEQIYRFIHEQDNGIIDESLRQKVVLCSPLTLFIVLSIIRQASDNFALEMSSREILILLNNFKKQWKYFAEKMDEVDKRLRRTYESYTELMMRRKNELEKPLKNIDGLMLKHGVNGATGDTVETFVLTPESESVPVSELLAEDAEE
jgi:DNA recombination protein RmuC